MLVTNNGNAISADNVIVYLLENPEKNCVENTENGRCVCTEYALFDQLEFLLLAEPDEEMPTYNTQFVTDSAEKAIEFLQG